MQEIIEKYSSNVIKNIDKENIYKIIRFLTDNNCDYIEDILIDYLDIFKIDYDMFVKKYNELNKKYEDKFLLYAGENMNLLEEFYI